MNRSNNPGTDLFLETSAQIFRLAGSPGMRRGIEDLIANTRKSGSSEFVRREFEAVYIGLYDCIANAVGRVIDQHKPRLYLDLWYEIMDLLPLRIPGGDKLLNSFTAALFDKYGHKIVAPIEVKNFIIGQRAALQHSFYYGTEFFDLSTCCVWPGLDTSRCTRTPAPTCRLKLSCLDHRDRFLESVRTLAGANREESKWLKDNLDRLRSLRGFFLLEMIGKHPGAFGDLLIFWEAPDNWTILTRDKTFKLLKDSLRHNIFIYIVRLPRKYSGRKCFIQLLASPNPPIEAILNDYNSKGACVIAAQKIGKIGSKVVLTGRDYDGVSREGIIRWILPDSTGVRHGIRLPGRMR